MMTEPHSSTGGTHVRKILVGALAAGMLLVPAASATAVSVPTGKKSAAVAVSATPDNRLYVDVNPDKGRGFWNIKVQRWTGKKWVTKKNYRTQGPQETRTTAKLSNGTYRVVVKPKYGYKGKTSSRVVLPAPVTPNPPAVTPPGVTPPVVTPPVVTPPVVTAPVVTAPVVPGSFAGHGTFQVGSQIQPGLYRSSSSDSGYWERLSGAGGTLDEILANGLVDGQVYVQIASTDAYFSTTRMDRWVPVDLSAPGPQAMSFIGDGMFMVGVDLAPGTYQATSLDSGYWGRLGGASGVLDDVLANDLITTGDRAIVTIEPTDKFFTTSGMGTWTKIG